MEAPVPRHDFPPEILSRIVDLLEDQIFVLRRIDERQNAADLSKQPMPEVPATSSSAWNALLRSCLSETINPKVERWRSGLDALLVFLGLFSAIVTSFLVDSLTSLQEDQSVRTNELLTNLTEIIIVLSRVPTADLRFTPPEVFHPDPTDVRLNAFWSLSLIISLSIAALAVSCRGYLNMVGWSRFTKASEKLIDIQSRWASSERFLGPTIQLLPQLLVIPVLLFIAGLLDTLFSSVLQLRPAPTSILFTSGVSLFFISAVAIILVYSLVHRDLNPTGSPFRRTFDHFRTQPKTPVLDRQIDLHNSLSTKAPSVYHQVVQEIHDDDALNEASAALYNIIQSLGVWPRHGATSTGLLDQERATFLHLLSPEASTRSNRTAVQVINRIQQSNRITYSVADMTALVPALLHASRRYSLTHHTGHNADLFDSPFIHAMAIVSNAGAISEHHPPILGFLSSDYIDNERFSSHREHPSAYDTRTKAISSVVEVLFAKIADSLAEESFAGMAEDDIVDKILSPDFQDATKPSTGRTPANFINPIKIVSALIHTHLPQDMAILTLIIRWLFRSTSALSVLRATQTHVAAINIYDAVSPTILFFIASIVCRTCLARDSSESGSGSHSSYDTHISLLDVCVTALLKIVDTHQFHPQLPALVSMAVGVLRRQETLLKNDHEVVRRVKKELILVRGFLQDSTWRWSAKQRSSVLAELETLELESAETVESKKDDGKMCGSQENVDLGSNRSLDSLNSPQGS